MKVARNDLFAQMGVNQTPTQNKTKLKDQEDFLNLPLKEPI